jgi:hypothetical protein
MVIDLFDKIINVDLIANDGVTERILCPQIGQKPTIGLVGEYGSKTVISNIQLRVTNFYASRPLSDYTTDGDKVGYIQITTGYSNSLMTTIYGQCLTAYQESANPDGVTCFDLLIGKFQEWVGTKLSVNFPSGTAFTTILNKLASELKMNIKIGLSGLPTVLNLDFAFNGYAIDLVYKLKQMFPYLVIRPDGRNIWVFAQDSGTGVTHTLKHLTHAKKDAGVFTLTGPWIPNCLPGDIVQADPVIFKAAFGSQIMVGDKFIVLTSTFSFSTNDEMNDMTLVCRGLV